MAVQLSIIVPCYNCASTLSQAVDSILIQKISIPYEVIFVDDASSDETPTLLPTMRARFMHSKICTHPKNRGGGAARNTGIRASKGKYVLCLDSDNYLDAHAINDLLRQIQVTNADGVVFHRRKFFYKTTLISTVHENPIRDDSFTLADLFNGSKLLMDNFLYTKEAYDRTGGYPEHHGFDTQGFEVRFLGRGNTLYTAPGSLIYHRQGAKNKSYFERVYEHGDFSINMFLIYEEILDQLSEKIANQILNFDIFHRTSLDDNLAAFLSRAYIKDPAHFFAKKHAVKKSRVAAYLHAYRLFQKQEFKKCADECLAMIHTGFSPKTVYFLLLRAMTRVAGREESETTELITGLQPIPQTSMFRQNVGLIGVRKILRLMHIL